ncbi:MAG TPA: prolipoprotein diacylglyceryl transferase [Pirellulaceae bacterium]|nr:prolipoprotein diacylglyceryl transferase [Pirellulaceae bacterium]HMO93912.1 prolipoprotein diacylglyceryl transferase [Pirellulaceae bacterium]HMP68950.1 prolipoprotein diacylglyceryl transferase [Pirellulaceae bacterium]
MQQTLFVIPYWVFQGPLLIGWIVISLGIIGFSVVKFGWKKETLSRIPILLIVGLIIHFVLPNLMIEGTNPDDPNGPAIPIGLAVRGYGTMMLLAMLAGFGVFTSRATQVGVTIDALISVTFWIVVAGLVGARTLYVIQYSHYFEADSMADRLRLMVDMTRGGLVVYGSFVGAVIASVVVSRLHRIRYWLLADLLAPAFMLGLAIGRIGCFLNGCCFGGECNVDWIGVRFPAGSPPYMRQLEQGELLGLITDASSEYPQARVVQRVVAGSIADELGIEVGETIEIRHPSERVIRDRIQGNLPIESTVTIWSTSHEPRAISLDRLAQPPLNRGLPVHPTQIYGAINAFLLGGVLFFVFPYRWREGDAFAMMLMLYPITRFLLEYVRTDEAAIDPMGWFTISQWISLMIMTTGLVLFFAVRQRQPIRETTVQAKLH